MQSFNTLTKNKAQARQSWQVILLKQNLVKNTAQALPWQRILLKQNLVKNTDQTIPWQGILKEDAGEENRVKDREAPGHHVDLNEDEVHLNDDEVHDDVDLKKVEIVDEGHLSRFAKLGLSSTSFLLNAHTHRMFPEKICC